MASREELPQRHDEAEVKEQKRLRDAAGKCIGIISGKDPARSASVQKLVRELLVKHQAP